MFERIYKIINLGASICIILITIGVSMLLIQYYRSGSIPLLNSVQTVQPQAVNQPRPQRNDPYPGMKVSYQDINWSKNGRTLLFVLSTQCGFCNASTDFYKQTVQAKQSIKDLQFVAMFPQDKQQSEQYLKDNGIGIQDVRQSMPFSVGASGFPTLMLVDNTGTVQKSWVGKLPKEKELEVLEQITRTNKM
jgi:thioredoxin-related protein